MSVLAQFAQSSDYYSSSYSASGGDTAIGVAAFGFALIFQLIILAISYVVVALLLSRIFKKAGVEEWIAWVPVYNWWKFLELGGQQGFWAVLLFVPFVNIASAVFMCIAAYHIGLKLQKEGWFVLLFIFVSIVWLAWLAFDQSKWDGKTVSVAVGNGEAPGFVPAKADEVEKTDDASDTKTPSADS